MQAEESKFRQYLDGSLSQMECQYLDQQLNEDENLRKAFYEFKEKWEEQQHQAQLKAKAEREQRAKEQHKGKKKKRVRWLFILMMIGWFLLLIAVVYSLLTLSEEDIREKLEEQEKKQEQDIEP